MFSLLSKTIFNLININFSIIQKMMLLSIFVFFNPLNSFSQKDLGNGFYDYGPTSKSAYQRSIVATSDGTKNIILSWLFDHRGGFGLLMLDAQTGKAEQFYPPHPINRDAPYASLLSKDNKYYTLFNGYFTEFDPVKKQFTFSQKTTRQAAMAMLEDTEGCIWAATYPFCALVKFIPATNELKDFGSLNKENWAQYPKYIAADNSGWIYIAIGTTTSQIIAFDTKNEKAKPLFSESQRVQGTAYLYKGIDDSVYAKKENKAAFPWLILEGGKFGKSKNQKPPKAKYFKTGNQNLIHRQFPNGDVLADFNLTRREFAIKQKSDSVLKKIKFDYETDGSWSLGIISGANGKLYGGTAFPMQMFIYDPAKKTVENFHEYSQLNTMMWFNKKIFSGGYPRGDLIQYEPSKPWQLAVPKGANSNPAYLFTGSPNLNRPHRIKGLKDQKTIVLSGTPDYGYTGGGLVFYDLKLKKGTLLKHTEVVKNQSTWSLEELPGDKILGGTTIGAGTGGEIKSTKAVLYIMDVKSKKIEWTDSLLNQAKTYNDLLLSNDGFVYGFINSSTFFVFDVKTKKMISSKNITKEFGTTTGEQCQRIFVKDKKKDIYVLFKNKIAKINQRTHELELVATSPVEITAGGDYLDGKIYFISQSHICSYKIN